MDVLLVAAKKDMINDYTTVVTEAGLAPVVVDVDAFAVQNMFAANYDIPEKETVVLINAGASVVNINIISNGITVFTRDVTIGGNQFTEEIQKQLNVSYEEAEALKIGGNRADADAVVPQEVERVLVQRGRAGGRRDPALAGLLRGHRRRRQLQQGLPLGWNREDSRAVQDHRERAWACRWRSSTPSGRSKWTTASSTRPSSWTWRPWRRWRWDWRCAVPVTS